MEQDTMIMIPYVVHEGDMAREERKQKRLWILTILSVLAAALITLKPLLSNKHLKSWE